MPRPDVSLAHELLGWEPAVDLPEGVGKATQYFTELVVKRRAGPRIL